VGSRRLRRVSMLCDAALVVGFAGLSYLLWPHWFMTVACGYFFGRLVGDVDAAP
jgi:hypothetical protein